MAQPPHDSEELSRIYRSRFAGQASYRASVWRILLSQVFHQWIEPCKNILDLGAGQGEFINQVPGLKKFAMDLNPETRFALAPDVEFLEQDCSAPWTVPPGELDLVFTSNFFEHLPDKLALRRTLDEAFRALRSGGRLIAMGPNIRLVPGAYWDFWDHHLPLTERSLAEVSRLVGFRVERALAATLPYSMSQGFAPPLWAAWAYCRLPVFWPIFGKQFIVVLTKP